MTLKKKLAIGSNSSPVGAGGAIKEQRPEKGSAGSFSGTETGGPPRAADIQLKTWDAAVQLFSRRSYAEAASLFRQATQGPAVHVADKARSYEEICRRQISRPQVEFRTADDHFYYAVERLGARDLEQAQVHLLHALRLQPEGDHILYTMSLCCGFSGDGNGACENLKRAIDLDPKNRVMAKQDSDFTSLARQFPGLRALLAVEAPGKN
jgi:hypothetical protein